MNIKDRLGKLRTLFNSHKIEGYIIPSTDEYMSEYTAPYARRLEYITGFTGSNGIALVLSNKVLFFTDGRYLSQASKQMGEGFEIYDLQEINAQLGEEVLGYDPMVFTHKQLESFGSVSLKPVEQNLIDQIWEDQPAHPSTEVYKYDLEYSYEESSSKIEKIRKRIRDSRADYCLFTAADSICWLLNIRASDVEFSPLMLGYCVVGLDQIWLFTDKPNNQNSLSNPQLPKFLSELKGRCIVDKTSCPVGLFHFIADPIDLKDPCQLMKACKHKNEIEGAQSVHLKDAVAVCETLAWIMQSLEEGSNLTEFDIGLKLTDFRAKQYGYIMDSFPAIVGYRDNGAIIHYRADQDTAKKIEGRGLLLIDSGGHYLGGTTDITRVVAIGKPTDEQIERYTDVLKGHIALARQQFVQGTTGQNLDILARMYLWQKGLDYAHGTGHGVGNFLSVHEGPQRISQFTDLPIALQEGMILSNEPGYYKVGEFGIRIENLVYVSKSGKFMRFENLTFVPYCKDLIKQDMLTIEETLYLKEYNEQIMNKVYPNLSERAKAWLSENI